ncbi:glutathione S-transferase [Uliginosibacterium sp. sgz301328]|uniref:glutathione S-transferase n=1 Tax=Uliginosibacterium sp. sgz301328 TaxID=3243764 RepID=UPI00359EE453
MKLIGSYTSPFVRKIRIMLLEKEVPFEFVEESPWEPDTRVSDYNPLGKVPALVTDDGEVFFDSPVVASLVEMRFSNRPLLPADALDALRVRQVEALVDGTLDAAVAIRMELQRPAEIRVATWLDRQSAKVVRGLDALEQRAAKGEWLAGPSMTLADIAFGCAVFWLDFRQIHDDWRNGRPALAALADRLAQRDSFQNTLPV